MGETCTDDFYDGDGGSADCPNCGGEGIIYDCIDGCCLDAEHGCDLCAYRCPWCSPYQPAQKDGDG